MLPATRIQSIHFVIAKSVQCIGLSQCVAYCQKSIQCTSFRWMALHSIAHSVISKEILKSMNCGAVLQSSTAYHCSLTWSTKLIQSMLIVLIVVQELVHKRNIISTPVKLCRFASNMCEVRYRLCWARNQHLLAHDIYFERTEEWFKTYFYDIYLF